MTLVQKCCLCELSARTDWMREREKHWLALSWQGEHSSGERKKKKKSECNIKRDHQFSSPYSACLSINISIFFSSSRFYSLWWHSFSSVHLASWDLLAVPCVVKYLDSTISSFFSLSRKRKTTTLQKMNREEKERERDTWSRIYSAAFLERWTRRERVKRVKLVTICHFKARVTSLFLCAKGLSMCVCVCVCSSNVRTKGWDERAKRRMMRLRRAKKKTGERRMQIKIDWVQSERAEWERKREKGKGSQWSAGLPGLRKVGDEK